MMGNAADNPAPTPQLGFGMFLMPVHDPHARLGGRQEGGGSRLSLDQPSHGVGGDDEVVIAGDPATVTQQINDLRARIDEFGTLVLVAHDWDDKQRWTRSLELFGTDVIPALTA